MVQLRCECDDCRESGSMVRSGGRTLSQTKYSVVIGGVRYAKAFLQHVDATLVRLGV